MEQDVDGRAVRCVERPDIERSDDVAGRVVPEAIAVVPGDSAAVQQQTLTIGSSSHPLPGEWGAVACYERGGVTEHIAHVRFNVIP